MNVNYSKNISIGLLKFALSLLAILFIQIAANAQSYTQEEQNCFDQVQNKVAYDQLGTKAWNPVNIRKLCKGTTNPAATISCFKNIISSFNDWNRGINECSETSINNVQTNPNQEQTCFDMVQGKVAYDQAGNKQWSEANIRNLCRGTTNPSATIACFQAQIRQHNDWSRGIAACQPGKMTVNSPNGIQGETQLNPEPLQDSTTKNSADSGMIARTITLKNNSGFEIQGVLYQLNSSNVSREVAKTKGGIDGAILGGVTETFGSETKIPSDDLVEFRISLMGVSYWGVDNSSAFRAILPRNKDYTTFCYEVTGTLFDPSVKTCDGSPTYESKYISFKNEAGFDAKMSLTYYPVGKTTTNTVDTATTRAGYQRKLYLPLDSDTDKPMTLKVNMGVTNQNLKQTNISLSNFDSDCYKVWGDAVYPKISPCSLNPNARTIKLWNNSGFISSLSVTYYDKDQSGKDVGRDVSTNKLQLTQTETIEVPNGTSPTPVKIIIYNNYTGKAVLETTAHSNYTGELCYKVEGTSFAPTAATCDDTVGDTTGETRQIRFQNEAGYDAQMIVTYFVDEVINGQKMVMPKTLTTGMINGLGGKFRLVTIPKNTSKGMPITITLEGNATVKGNDAIFSTTLDADFVASPQPCFKVKGTLFDPSGGKCNQ